MVDSQFQQSYNLAPALEDLDFSELDEMTDEEIEDSFTKYSASDVKHSKSNPLLFQKGTHVN